MMTGDILMRTMLLSVALVGTLMLIGCQKKADPMTEVPSPSGDVRGDAVYIGPESDAPITIIGAGSPPPSPQAVTYQVPTPAGTGATGGTPSGVYQSTPTYRPVATPPQQPQAQSYGGQGGVHTVQRGETLWSIAARYYGDGQRWRDIARANNIPNEHQLRIGQRLQLP